MECLYCNGLCTKKGQQKNGRQKYCCKDCGRYRQGIYTNKAWMPCTNVKIVAFLREGVGIRGIGRLARIAKDTVTVRIKKIAASIKEPPLALGKTYEVDELRTFVKHKDRKVWVVCAYERETKQIVRFSVGSRSNKTLKRVLDGLHLSKAKCIYTDNLKNYRYLIEKSIHRTTRYGTNRVERAHFTLRTHLRRLHRRTLCFSKSIIMLECVVRVYLCGLSTIEKG